ncbi:MAG: hypothetical protein K2L80_10150 [Muribaculaceae bacterium]|nr:hypothetical protein [Muribaculaceae bacterium]
MITSEQLKAECLRRRYAALLEKPDTFPSGHNWAYIIEHRMTGLGPALYRKYLVASMLQDEQRSVLHTTALKHFPEYLRAVDRCHALDTVYGDYSTMPDEFVRLVVECRLFDARRLMDMLESGSAQCVGLTVRCIEAFQPEYGVEDLRDMEALLYKLRHLPPLGRIEERRSLLGVKRVYVCPSGHCTGADAAFCPECGMDIYGLDESGRGAIEEFGARCEALRSLIS